VVSVPRSQRLVSFTSTAAGQSGVFRCPAGYVTLVKHAAFYNGNAAAQEVVLQVYAADSDTYMRLFDKSIATLTTDEWSGFVVLHPQDIVYCFWAGAQVTGWVSGAVLAGANPFPPATSTTFLGDRVQPLPAVGT
jgi:hypothetical protein